MGAARDTKKASLSLAVHVAASVQAPDPIPSHPSCWLALRVRMQHPTLSSDQLHSQTATCTAKQAVSSCAPASYVRTVKAGLRLLLRVPLTCPSTTNPRERHKC